MKGPVAPGGRSRIAQGLAGIRRLRRLFLGLLFSFPLWALLLGGLAERLKSPWPFLGVPLLFLLGVLLQRRLHRSLCPRCGDFFFIQTLTAANYTPESAWSFPPQKRCRSCGLQLYP